MSKDLIKQSYCAYTALLANSHSNLRNQLKGISEASEAMESNTAGVAESDEESKQAAIEASVVPSEALECKTLQEHVDDEVL